MTLSRFARLLLFFLFIGVLSYFYVLNPHSIRISLVRGEQIEAPAALVLIFTFCLGMFSTAVGAFIWGTRLRYAQWKERKQFELERAHAGRLRELRGFVATGQFERALPALRRMTEEDTKNIDARLLLADTLRELGHTRQALQSLDDARTNGLHTTELLFRAAELNEELANPTAALDNYTILLEQAPDTVTALRNAVTAAVEVERFDTAVELQQRLMRAVPSTLSTAEEDRLAELRLLAVQHRFAPGSVEYREGLEQIVKLHRTFAPAFAAIGEVEAANGKVDQAAKYLTKAFSSAPKAGYLTELADIWLRTNQPERAVSGVKSLAIALERDSESGFSARLALVELLLKLEMHDEASAELRKLAEVEGFTPSILSQRKFKELEAIHLQKQGRTVEAFEALREALRTSETSSASSPITLLPIAHRAEQPAPQLSTP